MANSKCLMCGSTAVYANPDAYLRSKSSIDLFDAENRIIAHIFPRVCAVCGSVTMAVDTNLIRDLASKRGWTQT